MRTPAFTRLFGDRPKTVVGMIHLRALPGTPRHAGGMGPILDQALAEAEIYRAGGIHALMVENMHDIPYVQRPGPEIATAMAVIAREVKRAHPALPLAHLRNAAPAPSPPHLPPAPPPPAPPAGAPRPLALSPHGPCHPFQRLWVSAAGTGGRL